MPFDSRKLAQKLRDLAMNGNASRYVVAFSGGLDSTALLHALAAADMRVPLLAVHVQHDLQGDAPAWEQHCQAFAGSLGVPYQALKVQVPRNSGLGLEAAAREARYSKLRSVVQDGDWILSAHQEDDQAETLLLNLLRGSGMAGIAGIGEVQAFGTGLLVRPLLRVSRKALHDYATRHALTWLVDPSNADCRFDRNFLRARVMPLFEEHWPAAKKRVARSASLASEAAELLEEMADADIEKLGKVSELQIDGISALSDARARNVLRRAIRRIGLPAAPEKRLRQIIDSLIPAKEDAVPLVAWSGAEARRYRGTLYLMAAASRDSFRGPASTQPNLSSAHPEVSLCSLGRLALVPGRAHGIRKDIVDAGLALRFRRGGETIRPFGSPHTQKLKKLFQQAGIVPWMRGNIPLLYAGDELVAVADLWISDTHAAEHGLGIVWHDRPQVLMRSDR